MGTNSVNSSTSILPTFRRGRGYSLVEVITGLVIATIFFVGAISAVMQAQRVAQSNAARQRAVQVLDAQVELLRAMSFDDLKARVNNGLTADTGQDGIAQLLNGAVPPITLGLTARHPEVGGATQTGIYEVRLTASWELQGRTERETFVTWFAEGGVSDRRFADAN